MGPVEAQRTKRRLNDLEAAVSALASIVVSPNGAVIYESIGNPNGVVTANRSSICIDQTNPATPVIYIKTTSGTNTGWI
jgi:hypothetical protein